MKTSKFTAAQIAFALKQAELGTKVEEVCRKLGISEFGATPDAATRGRESDSSALLARIKEIAATTAITVCT